MRLLTDCDPCDISITVNLSVRNSWLILYLHLFSSTVVEALIWISDVHDQQIVGFRGFVLHQMKTREWIQNVYIFYVYSAFSVQFCSQNKRRLVLMRTVPVPHYEYSRWSFAVTVQSDVVSWSDCNLQHWSRDPIMTAGNNSWNTNTTIKAGWNITVLHFMLQKMQVTAWVISQNGSNCNVIFKI